jgi:hypothetical protein
MEKLFLNWAKPFIVSYTNTGERRYKIAIVIEKLLNDFHNCAIFCLSNDGSEIKKAL